MVSHVERFDKGKVPQKFGCDQCNVKYCYKTSLNRHKRFVQSKNKQISCVKYATNLLLILKI